MSMSRLGLSASVRLVVIIAAALACIGCGSTNSSSRELPGLPPISVSVSPATGAVQPGATVQFFATVINTTNTGVSWEADGVAGGDASVGTISSSGLYTAPVAVPSNPNVTIKAVSLADTSKSGAA